MTSDLDAYPYDNDLSMLTKLRREIKTSRHRLVNELHDVTSSVNSLKDSTTVNSPVKNPSPLRKSYIPSRTPSREGKSFLNTDRNYEIDTSLLRDENTRYLNLDDYEKNSYLNDRKRDRFLNTIISPSINRSQSQDATTRYHKDKYKDLGFRPKSIPDLRPDTKKYNLDSVKRPASKSPTPRSHPADVKTKSVSNMFTNRDDLDRILDEEIPEDKNDDFSELVKRYRLTSRPIKIYEDTQDDKNNYALKNSSSFKTNVHKLSPFKDERSDFELQKQNDYLLRELRSYKSQPDATLFPKVKDKPSPELLSQNKILCAQVKDLEEFIEFLEANFDKVYRKSQIYKSERHQLHKKNQELIFIIDYYKSLLSKNTDIETSDKIDSNDSTTQNLLAFQPMRQSKTFRGLSSIKKFKALSYMVIATVRLKKRALSSKNQFLSSV